jgi:glycosyltransferase involved in cell wall biosynthesis
MTKNRPKVLLIAPSFFMAGGDTRILECIKRGLFGNTHIMTGRKGKKVLTALKLKNVSMHVIPLIPENEYYFFFRNRLSTFLYPFVRLLLYTLYLPALIMADIRPNFTISTTHYLHDLLIAIFYSKLSKTKLVVYVHHLFPSLSVRSKYNTFFKNLLAYINDILSIMLIRIFADKIITYPSMMPEAVRKGLPENKMQKMMSGVNLKYISKVPKSNEVFDACFVGRVARIKGVFDLIDVWARVCSKVPDLKLAIIGVTTHDTPLVIKTIAKNNLKGNIIMKGFLSEHDKYAVMKSSKIFVFPSHEEGLGIAIIEALACGLPVIAYNQIAYKAFGQDPLIRIPIGDKKYFSNKILTLLSDRDKRINMSKKAKEISDQFDWEKLVKEERVILFG